MSGFRLAPHVLDLIGQSEVTLTSICRKASLRGKSTVRRLKGKAKERGRPVGVNEVTLTKVCEAINATFEWAESVENLCHPDDRHRLTERSNRQLNTLVGDDRADASVTRTIEAADPNELPDVIDEVMSADLEATVDTAWESETYPRKFADEATSADRRNVLLQSHGSRCVFVGIAAVAIVIAMIGGVRDRESSSITPGLAVAPINVHSLTAEKLQYETHRVRAKFILGQFTEVQAKRGTAIAFREAAQLLDRGNDGEPNADQLFDRCLYTQLLRSCGDPKAGFSLLREVLYAQRKLLGANHLDVAYSEFHLGRRAREHGGYKEAEELLNHAVDVWETRLGESHMYSLACRAELGRLSGDIGEYEIAAATLRRVCERAAKALGAESRFTLGIAMSLGHMQTALGQFDAARETLERTVNVQTSTLGANHAHTLQCRRLLAAVYAADGRNIEAEQSLRSLLSTLNRLNEEPTTEILVVEQQLANVLIESKRHDEAESLLRKSVIRHEREYGGDSPQTLACRQLYATVLIHRNRLDLAAKILPDIVAREAAVFGRDHAMTQRGFQLCDQANVPRPL